MKNLFVKFLLLAAVAVVVAGCKKEKNESENYMQIGDHLTRINLAISSDASQLSVLFAGEGIEFVENGVKGIGNVVGIECSLTPGTYTITADQEIPYGVYMLNYNVQTNDDTERGILLPGTTITYTMGGNFIVMDIVGTCSMDMAGSVVKPFKLHFAGPMQQIMED